MRMYDLIAKKRAGEALTREEIDFMIKGYVEGEIPDYQMSAFLMAVCFNGMSKSETHDMTMAVAGSGDMVDLSGIGGIKVDKHSTGGVGDKTTLIIAPIAAACGAKVAKMSGRGLGHTGGTVDKLESIPGLRTSIERKEFFDIVNRIGLSVIGQSGNLTPADKKLYALRDVTDTVDSIPLIAVSIMSKKLAAGSDCILLDVKTGSGAFMKTVEDSIALAEEMVSIGESAGRKTMALITNMDIPLGNNIGNSLEVIEAVDTLRGEGPKDLTEVCLKLAENMLILAGMGEPVTCREMARNSIQDGSALERLVQMVEAQGGDPAVIRDTGKLAVSGCKREVVSSGAGFIRKMDTEMIGISSGMLGAGRVTKDSEIDYGAGIILRKKTGDYVEAGTVLADMYASDESLFSEAEKRFLRGIEIGETEPEKEPLIYALVTKDKVTRF